MLLDIALYIHLTSRISTFFRMKPCRHTKFHRLASDLAGGTSGVFDSFPSPVLEERKSSTGSDREVAVDCFFGMIRGLQVKRVSHPQEGPKILKSLRR